MMENKKRKIFNWILNILLIILLIIGIYLFFTRIFGYSPTDFQLILWLFGFFSTMMIKMFNLTYNLNREVGELKVKNFEAFNKIKIDIDIVSDNIGKIISRMDEFEKEFKVNKKLFKTKRK